MKSVVTYGVILALAMVASGCVPQATPAAIPTATVPIPTFTAAPTATAEPTPASAYAHEQVIRFDAEPLNFRGEGALLGGKRARYELQVLPGEMLNVWLMSPENNAILSILGPAGLPLLGTGEEQGITRWTVILPDGGTHSIIVSATGDSAIYVLTVHTAMPQYQPLPLQECQAIQENLMQVFAVRFNLIDTPFADPITRGSGVACTLEANGTGADFGSVAEAMTKVRGVLAGWQENPSYAADGPTASMTAFFRDNALVVVMVSWEPRADANCPTDQPISACVLAPEQQLYSVRLQAVQN